MKQTLFLCLILSYIAAQPFSAHADTEKKQRPDWVEGNTNELFSEQRYLTAVGSGKSREQANQDAKKQLAAIFRAKISSESSTQSQSSLSESTGAKVEGKGQSSSQSNINLKTDLDLRGVGIKKYYYDPTVKEHYALAVMDKLQVKNSYQMDLLKIKNKITAKYELFSNKPNTSLANEILKLKEQYDLLGQEYAVVNNGHSDSAPLSESQVEEIKDKIASLQNSKAILLEFTGDENQTEFQELITSCLSEKSIGVIAKAKDEQNIEFHVLYNLREKSKFMEVQGWKKIQFSSLAVIKKGNVLVQRKLISKEGTGRTKENAFDSVKQELSQEICSEVAAVVTR